MLVLQCIGYVSGISDAMLGITFLAWGNSIGGDFIFYIMTIIIENVNFQLQLLNRNYLSHIVGEKNRISHNDESIKEISNEQIKLFIFHLKF